MAQYKSTEPIPSRKVEGATIVVRKMSEGRRITMDEILGPLMDAKERESIAIEKVREELGFHEEMSPDDCAKHYEALDKEQKAQLENIAKPYYEAVRNLNHAYFEIGLVRVDDLELDGDPKPSNQMIFDSGPRPLYLEIIECVKRQLGLLPEERENLELLSTSGGQEDGKAKNTIATAAEKPETISNETVSSTSPS